jgi:hypothetical protein
VTCFLGVRISCAIPRTHRTSDPNRFVVNWETAKPGTSVVRHGLSQDCTGTVAVEESKLLASENSYVLLTFTKNPLKMAVEIKNLDGQVLDRKEFEAGGSK